MTFCNKIQISKIDIMISEAPYADYQCFCSNTFSFSNRCPAVTLKIVLHARQSVLRLMVAESLYTVS